MYKRQQVNLGIKVGVLDQLYQFACTDASSGHRSRPAHVLRVIVSLVLRATALRLRLLFVLAEQILYVGTTASDTIVSACHHLEPTYPDGLCVRVLLAQLSSDHLHRLALGLRWSERMHGGQNRPITSAAADVAVKVVFDGLQVGLSIVGQQSILV